MPDFPNLILPSTREAALSHARQFAPLMGSDYAHRRNEVVPGHPHVSRLAAAVRVRLITEDELAQIALETHGNLSRCGKFVQEIQWRSYWRSWLELRPSVWSSYQTGRDGARQNLDKWTKKKLEATENGESGVAAMDLFARELVETGYLHNHARMWFAAFWIHNQELPWQLGADFFERHLVCACPASNTLSWRWVAGLQTAGKTYLARRSNLEKYCDPFYLDDDEGLERLEKPRSAIVADEVVPNPRQPDFEIAPPKGDGPTGIWISEDDLAAETSALADTKMTAIAVTQVLASQEGESNGFGSNGSGSNGLRDAYRGEAVADSAARATQAWGAPSSTYAAQNPAELASQIGNWAQENALRRVVALKPFVGPSGDALPELQHQLEAVGISLHLLRRASDAQLLPHATSGYFKFWKGYEDQFKRLGLTQ